MAVESVVCPHCGKEAKATVPEGQYLSRIIKSRFTKYSDSILQHCKCDKCNRWLYAETYYKK